MPIYERGGTWYCDIRTAGGQRIRRSLGTSNRKEAEQLHDKIKAESWQIKHLDKTPDYTWDQACLRYLQDKANKKSLSDDITKIKYFTGYFRNRVLRTITRDEVVQAVNALVHTRSSKTPGNSRETGKPVSNATRNRYLAFMSTLFNMAKNEWDWIEKSPVFKKAKEPRRRVRWITRHEAKRLIEELAPHLKPVVSFALATGLRHANIIDMEWSQIDLVRGVAWVHADQTKAGESIGVPLNQMALDVLVSQVGKHRKYVFTFRGRKIKDAAAEGFQAAVKRAGISNFRFHDLRHTWASWLVQQGVPLHVIQELGGWHSFEMVQRYAHLAPDHLRGHVDVIDRIMDTNWSQEPHALQTT